MINNQFSMKVMKKFNYLSLAALVLVSATIISCKKDVLPEGYDSRYVSVSISAEANAETKALDSVENYDAVDLSTDDTPLFIMGTRTINNAAVNTPATKGTAVTIDNINPFTVDMSYPNGTDYVKGAHIGNSQIEDQSYSSLYASLIDDAGNKVSWPDDCDNVTFNFWGFNALSGAGESFSHNGNTVTYAGVGADKTAAVMTDFVVANTAFTHKHNEQNIVSLRFYHALAAVKFNFELNPEEGVTIEKVTIKNVKNNGSFTVDPSKSFNSRFTWTTSGDGVDYTYTPAAGDTDATRTFFIIPQDLTNVVVAFTVNNNGKVFEVTTKGKNLVDSKKWEAGYLYTYTVDKSVVGNVGIAVREPNFTQGDATKSNVFVENTKRSTVFVRAAIIANWCNNNHQPVLPCTSTELAAIQESVGSSWVLATDGYFYYTKSLPGYESSDLLIDETGFTRPTTPRMAGLHLEMKILSQAVECDSNGTTANASLTAAWGTPTAASDNSAIAFTF